MFKNYQSKPIIRKAYKIEEADIITEIEGSDSTFLLVSSTDLFEIMFKAHQLIAPGDYIVYLNQKDIYHCSAEVFKERNIIPAVESNIASKETKEDVNT